MSAVLSSWRYDSLLFYNGSSLCKTLGFSSDVTYYIRTLKSKERPDVIRHQLVVQIHYILSTWLFYNYASDDTGRDLEVTVLDKDFYILNSGNGNFTETLGLALPGTYLKERQGTGFSIRLRNKRGMHTFVIQVPPSYIRGHLLALANPGIPVKERRFQGEEKIRGAH